MSFESPPKDASVENLLEVCKVLREGSLPRDELYESVDQGRTLVSDNIRYGIGLGFLEELEDEVSTTQRGIEASYNQETPEKLAEQFQAGLQEYELYRTALKELLSPDDWKMGEITKSDVLRVFRTSIGLEGSEKTLGAASTTFIKTLEAAGLGDYIVGRGGKETRLELTEDIKETADSIIKEKEDDRTEHDQALSPEKVGSEQKSIAKSTTTEPNSNENFEINLELTGDESPEKVEELIVGVRRGLTRNIDFQDQEGEEEPVDLDEKNKDYQSNSDEEVINSESEDGSETNDEPESESSDQSLDTFVGKESATDGE